MHTVQALEIDVGRVLRLAASRSSWALLPAMADLFRISHKLEHLLHELETSPAHPSPDELNRLARAFRALDEPFSAPLFRAIMDRIDSFNLKLASYAESVFLAGHPEFQQFGPETGLRVGPASQNSTPRRALLRSA